MTMENIETKSSHRSAIPQYIAQARIEVEKSHDEDIKAFFALLHAELSPPYKTSDKNHIPRALRTAMRNLLLQDINIPEKEIALGKLKALENMTPDKVDFLLRKRPDYILESKDGKRIVILELKTNISFNDLSAAIVQAALIKKRLIQGGAYRCYIASIHMSSWNDSLDKYRWMNDELEKPLDGIWVFSNNIKKLERGPNSGSIFRK